ncbi:hypothetical protein IR010_19895 [Flavobacterium sp. MR2016-29]|uniref:hypothetical protein n=1 Tax=Flavobacterium sp. MR2016-29 TaxID=2783795 RepID=UPI00188D16EB|nr:hypothetical protein [Flavobacterium sp. MR2016-29]MBF4494812.1 hypothetical protein [Flavobacterium sp. MR2016-29]
MKENPHLIIFKSALTKQVDLSRSRVYHIKSFEYTESNMILFNKNRDNSNFFNILDKMQYNSQSNNVGLYYVVNLEGQNDIYMISDPLELYEKEYVIEKYCGTLDERVMGLSTVKQIN